MTDTASVPSTTTSTGSSPDTRDLFVQEYEFVVEKTGDTTTVQYFCNRDNEPVYFPDRTLATLFQVNLSTLRGRFNRMTKKHEGYRLLISEKSKTRLSSLHFINWGTENFVDTDGSRSASPLHGLVALNHIVLVNYALAEWIAYNHERLGTSIHEIENNLKKKRTALPHPSLLYRNPTTASSSINNNNNNNNPNNTSNSNTTSIVSSSSRDRQVPRRPGSEEMDIPNFSPSASPSSSPPQAHSLLTPLHTLQSLPVRKRTRADSSPWCTDLSQFKPTNDLVPVHTLPSLHHQSQQLPSYSSMYSLPKLMKLDNQGVFNTDYDESMAYDSDRSPRSPSSPNKWGPIDNTIQCILEGENVCHRLDLSCLEGFGALRTALSALFRVNSFNILYQTILDSGYMELGHCKDNDEEKWLQFLTIVKKICVKPFSVTPQLKNLLS